MNLQNRPVQILLSGLIGILLSLPFVFLKNKPGLLDLERRSRDYRYRYASFEDLASDQIKLVLIDDRTVHHFEQAGKTPPYRWPVHEFILEYILSGDPAAVSYDILFKKKNRYAGQEQEVKDFLNTAGKGPVIHPISFQSSTPSGHKANLPMHLLEPWNRLSFPEQIFQTYPHFEHPPSAFLKEQYTTSIGSFTVQPDPDGTLRRYPLFFRHNESIIPSLAIATLNTKLDGRLAKSIEIHPRNNRYDLKLAEHTLPLDENGNFPIFWYGKTGTFDSIPYAKIFESKVATLKKGKTPSIPKDTFKNQIVIIASAMSGNMMNRPTDTIPTSVEDKYLAPEVHATVISNLIKGHALFRLPGWGENLLIVFMGAIVATLVGFFVHVRWQVLSSVTLLAAYSIAAVILFQWFHASLPMISPVASGLTALTGAALFNYFTEGRRRAFIRDNFQRLVPDGAVAELESSFDVAQAEVGERRQVSILFADIRGFTDFSEAHEPEEVVQFLNNFFDDLINVLFTYRGTLDKFMGDALLGYFGAPHSLAEPERNAVSAALDMIQRTREFADREGITKPEELGIGIGINTDDVVLGFMGGEEQIEYTAIGDGVNLASRLEGLTKKYGVDIVISETTKRRAGDHFVYRCLDRVRVKGKTEAVEIYEVCCRVGEHEQKENLARNFNAGVSAYRNRDWEEARASFEHCQALKPDDKPSKIMLDRVRELEASPPGPDWKPVETLTEK